MVTSQPVQFVETPKQVLHVVSQA